MHRLTWDGVLRALVLVKIGQELGTDSQIARAVHALLAAILGA